jgi:hypothetical protein
VSVRFRATETQRTLVCVSFLFLVSLAAIAQTGKVEAITTPPDGASEAVRKALEEKGHRVFLDDGSVACTIWWRKSVPAQGKKDVPGSVYPRLAESTLLGVLSFPHASTDYRGQAIAAGTYTLRYGLQPADGNHMGVSPTRDFLLLIPASSDADPKAVFKLQELVDLSRKATGTRHPGPLNLIQPESSAISTVSKDDEEHWIFSTSLKLASGEELPIALVVKGTAPQ